MGKGCWSTLNLSDLNYYLLNIAYKMKKKFHQRSRISFVSQTEEVMYCRQEKSKRNELVMQIFMILGYLNFSFSVLPVM